MSFFSQVLAAAQAAGVTPQLAVQTALGVTSGLSSTAHEVAAQLTQLEVVQSNPAARAAIATKLMTTPGVPAQALVLLEALADPACAPMNVVTLVNEINAMVTAANPII